MNNKMFIYRFPLKFQAIALMAILICSVAFIGCPEAEQMTGNVITPSEDRPPPPAEDEDRPPPPAEDEDRPPPPAG